MKEEFIYEFLGFWKTESKCKIIHIYKEYEHVFVFVDLGYGTSVTNYSEYLAMRMVDKYHLDPVNSPFKIHFFETYDETVYGASSNDYDEITYEWEKTVIGWKASRPKWQPDQYLKFQNLELSLF